MNWERLDLPGFAWECGPLTQKWASGQEGLARHMRDLGRLGLRRRRSYSDGRGGISGNLTPRTSRPEMQLRTISIMSRSFS